MADHNFTGDYWNSRYQMKETGWDIGFPSPPITEYINQLQQKDLPILIPGCGNAYEAEYLLAKGFTDITVIDIAPALTAALKERFREASGKSIRIVNGDFFDHQGQYHLVLEQTFFCALHPLLRTSYAGKMHELLVKGGHLAGVLFNTLFEKEGPPFGGTVDEYERLFAPKFAIKKPEWCYNSIEKRSGTEVFINLIVQ